MGFGNPQRRICPPGERRLQIVNQTCRRSPAPVSTCAPATADRCPADGPSTRTATSRPIIAGSRAKFSAGGHQLPLAIVNGAGHPPWHRARNSGSSPHRNTRIRPAGRTAPLLRTGTVLRIRHPSRQENPTMKLVRIATPGIVRRTFSSSFRKIFAVRAALHPLQHACAGMLQRHVDIFHKRGVFRDGIQQFLRDFIRIRIQKPHPLLRCGVSICANRASNSPAHLSGRNLRRRQVVSWPIRLISRTPCANIRVASTIPIQNGGCETCRDTAESRRKCRDDRSPPRS